MSASTERAPGVAIIGMACRFPGIDGVESFWQSLLRGDDRITRAPAARWDAGRYPDNVSNGGFLDGIDGFDTAFFAMSESEAAHMCPQQRLLLELAWHTLEHAGVVPSTLKGSDTGVFVGLCGHDFSILHWQQSDNLYLGTGTSNGVAANRISFQFGLHGPSFAVDAACSSSLVAVHLACRSIRAGECEQALAGSSNVLLVPEVTASLAQGGLISADGRCKSFGGGADGYVRSEGAGMVMLKRLDLAERDGDRILGVILASGMNHNGRSNGLTAPNPVAQSALIRRCVAQADVSAAQIDYLEAAATGTRLGDAIEAKAIRDSLVADRDGARALIVGSVKSNLGHLEGTGGIAGLIKTLLCIEHGRIPKSLHSDALNPLCQIDVKTLHVPQHTVAWERAREDRIAGVSSFGFGGSNAHLVVRGVAATLSPPTTQALRLLPLSAHSPSALGALVDGIRGLIDGDGDIDIDALAATAALGREHHRHRIALRYEDRASLRAALADVPMPSASQATSHAIVLRGGLDTCAAQLAQLCERNHAFADIVARAQVELEAQVCLQSWLRGTAVDAGQRPLLQLALDHCMARWFGQVLADNVTFVGEGLGEPAAAMHLLDIPLRHASALLRGDIAPLAGCSIGKRIALHAPSTARLPGPAWPWRAALLAALPDAQRCPVLDPAAVADGTDAMLVAIVQALYLSGARLHWPALHPQGATRHAALPAYRFQRSRHWPSPVATQTAHDGPDAGLAGEPLPLPLSDERRLRYRFDPSRSPALADHVIDGAVVLSAAAQIALCAQALFDAFGRATSVVLADVAFLAPLLLEHGRSSEAQLLIQPATADSGRCVLVAADASADPRWDVVFTADYSLDRAAAAAVLATTRFTPVASTFYEQLAARGHQYGAGYRWLRARGGDGARRFRLDNEGVATPVGVPWHPGALDSCFQAVWELTPDTGADTITLPRGIGRIELHRPGAASPHYIVDAEHSARVRTEPHHLAMHDADGRCLVALHDVQLVTIGRAEFAAMRAAAAASDTIADADSATHTVEALLKRAFDRVLGAPFAHDHAERPLPALGIDSLKAMELRGYLWRTFRADIGVAQLLGGASFTSLLQQLSADGVASSSDMNLQTAFAPAELDVVTFDDATQDAQVEIEL